MKRALVVGGARGIGLSIAIELSKRENIEKVHVVDKVAVVDENAGDKIESWIFDLTNPDYSIFSKFKDINILMITAGYGKLTLFRDISDEQILNYFSVNTLPAIRIIKLFYDRLERDTNFYCGVMVSIAGFMSSPFFSLYAATKAALKIFIESVNVELLKSGSTNRILNVSPGYIKGTSFSGGKTDIFQTSELAKSIIKSLERKEDLLIPEYDTIYKDVLERYHKEGIHSYEYKLESGRVK